MLLCSPDRQQTDVPTAMGIYHATKKTEAAPFNVPSSSRATAATLKHRQIRISPGHKESRIRFQTTRAPVAAAAAETNPTKNAQHKPEKEEKKRKKGTPVNGIKKEKTTHPTLCNVSPTSETGGLGVRLLRRAPLNSMPLVREP